MNENGWNLRLHHNPRFLFYEGSLRLLSHALNVKRVEDARRSPRGPAGRDRVHPYARTAAGGSTVLRARELHHMRLGAEDGLEAAR